MGVNVLSEASQCILDLFLFTRLFNSFSCEFLSGFGPFSMEVVFRDLFSFFEERLFGVFGSGVVVDTAVTLRFADDLLVDEGGGFRPGEHFVLGVEVFEFLVNLGLFDLEQSS